MEEFIARGTNLPSAYHLALLQLNQAPIVPCPDWNTTQKECSMTMVVTHPLEEPMISRCAFVDPMSLEQYRQEIVDGILDFEVGKGNWKYTYHDRMANYDIGNDITINQLTFVVEELQRNPYSRRAVIDIRDNKEDVFSDDPACLQHIQFFIRDNLLHMKVLFRSNDACKAAFTNAFGLICLQTNIADTIGVGVGTYTHRANSFHCYERDFKLLESYTNRIMKGENLFYNYSDDWEYLMEEAIPEIQKKIDILK